MKQHTKLLAAVFLLTTSVVMVIATSFAWMALSEKPVAQGIQIAIAGSHTVLVAPDITVVQEGQELHYPGKFSENLNFSDYEQYGYLRTLGGLLPVSTADGENWYIPTYYRKDDPQVLSGEAYVGQLRPTVDFVQDRTLAYANLLPEQLDNTCHGHYVYLDFWVVAPVNGYKLRVSTSAESAGSFVVDQMKPEQTTVNGQQTYTLTGTNRQTAASMRIGFLVNEDTVVDDSMLAYSKTEYYNKSYTHLQGTYGQQGVGALERPTTRFTIYEPNGDLHPTQVLLPNGTAVPDGAYVITEPLGIGGNPTSVRDRLTVQLTSSWMKVDGETRIEQMFRTFMINRDLSGQTADSLQQQFYTSWLQHQIYPYVTKGEFITNMEMLYQFADNKLVQAETLLQTELSGATEDVWMTQLTGGAPQRIRMYIWLEGQDVDCVSTAATGSFAISLELAGSNDDT